MDWIFWTLLIVGIGLAVSEAIYWCWRRKKIERDGITSFISIGIINKYYVPIEININSKITERGAAVRDIDDAIVEAKIVAGNMGLKFQKPKKAIQLYT